MHDENAFGILVSHFEIEEEEYAEDTTELFVRRFAEFRSSVEEFLVESPLGENVRASPLGHVVYLELADDEYVQSPIKWCRDLRARLSERDFRSVCIITHGGRWVDTEGVHSSGSNQALPSEPFRRALHAETATHGMPDEESAWGPGLYVDTEAIEALGLKPKNSPTVLSVAGADFYRLGS